MNVHRYTVAIYVYAMHNALQKILQTFVNTMWEKDYKFLYGLILSNK